MGTTPTAPPVAYTWELGIDWRAVETAGMNYLRQGFVQDNAPANLQVKLDDTIKFKILDVSSPPLEPGQAMEIRSFMITSKPAVAEAAGDSLACLQPTLPTSSTCLPSVAFGNSDQLFPAWVSEAVPVINIGRFLLSFFVQARSGNGPSRLFLVDPEMVVGPNMI